MGSWRLASVLCGAFLLTACSEPAPTAALTATLALPETVPMARRTRDVLDAGYAGQLAVQDGCLVIRSASSSLVVVWPSPGTTWDPVGGVVSLDGVSARVGQEVVLSGGEYRFPGDPGTVAWVSRPTDACLSIGGWWVASSMSVLAAAPK